MHHSCSCEKGGGGIAVNRTGSHVLENPLYAKFLEEAMLKCKSKLQYACMRKSLLVRRGG